MAKNTPAQLMQKWHDEIWNQARVDRIPVYLSPTARIHNLDETGADAIGPDGFRPFYEKLHGALPDLLFTMHEIIESGPTAAARWTATGTHQGDHLGLRATNNRLTITGMAFLRAENGMIIEAWNEWNRLAFALAVGAVTPVR